jgi:alkylated DNA repair dioxygenase AlkB
MDIQSTKLELIQYLLNTKKESMLLKIRELILQEKEEIIGYSGNGEPLTIEMLNAKLERAEKDYQAGRLTTDEDLEREIENW